MTKKQKRIEATLRAIYAGASGGVGDYEEVGVHGSYASVDSVDILARFIGGVCAYYGKDDGVFPFRVSDLAAWDQHLADLAVWLDETFEWEGL